MRIIHSHPMRNELVKTFHNIVVAIDLRVVAESLFCFQELSLDEEGVRSVEELKAFYFFDALA